MRCEHCHEEYLEGGRHRGVLRSDHESEYLPFCGEDCFQEWLKKHPRQQRRDIRVLAKASHAR